MKKIFKVMSLAVCLGFVGLTLAATPASAGSKAKTSKVDKRQTVAVVYFDYTGKDPEMSSLKKGLAAMLLSELSHISEVRFVERERIEAILAELKLSSSKAVDKKTAARIGKLLGVRYLVMGTYFTLLGNMRIDARLIEVETGKVVRSVGATGKPDDFMTLVDGLKEKLEKALVGLMPMQFSKRKQPKLNNGGTKTKTAKVKKRSKLNKKLAMRFSKALDAKDSGDTATAKKELAAVAQAAPKFTLARTEMAKIR